MSQLLEKRRRVELSELSDLESDDDVGDGSPLTAGVIERIVLKNFMCHDSFELNLGPQLNFIIGRNGSGKSAILTGISVGLGARATDTSRGSSIKLLIKDGKNTARVTIVLANGGEDAFQPDVFGDKIIVERKLQRQGVNGYFLKSADGKTVSTKKSLLDEILHKFNITVDNPMAFLSQDKAREFLTTTTDRTKYDYFLKGTSIEEILERYSLTSQNIQAVRDKAKTTQTHYDAACKKYDEALALYNQFKKSDGLRRRLQLLNGKMYWFNVSVYEKKLASYTQRMDQLKEEIAELEQNEVNTKREITVRNSERVKLVSEIDDLAGGVSQLTDAIVEHLNEFTKLKGTVVALEEDIAEGKRDIRANEDEIERSERAISAEHERIALQQGASKDVLSERLANLEARKKVLQLDEARLVAELDEVKVPKKSAELHDISEKLSAIETSIERNRRRKTMLESSQKDRYAPWGNNMHLILREIRHTSGWHKPPLGPIGLYVSVKASHRQWRDLVNTIYTKTLDSFLVCDEHDRRMLADILRRLRAQRNIIVRKYERFDYNHGKAAAFLTILDVVDVDNTDVFYTLIDLNSMERDVLCSSEGDALRAVADRTVHNAYCLYDSRGANRYSGNANNLRLDPVSYHQGDKLSYGSEQATAQDIAKTIAQLDADQTERHRLVRSLRDVKLKEQTQRDELKRRLTAQLKLVQQELSDVERDIFQVSDQLRDDADEGKIAALEDRIQECREGIAMKTGIVEGVQNDLSRIRKSYDQLKRKIQATTKEKNAALQNVEDKRAYLREFDIQGAQLSSNIDHYTVGIAKRQSALEEIQARFDATKQKKDDLLVEAQAKCGREDVPIAETDTSQSITDEYISVQKAVEEADKHVGRPYEEVQRQLLATKAVKDNVEQVLDDLQAQDQALDEDLANRFSYMNTTIHKSIREAMLSFEESLALRGFLGELRFGFAEKTLTMLVQTPVDQKPRTVESLSGGEKSFTQIALLLAIWRVMDLRIRGLDEFDVFMDSVNRTISIRLLLTQLRMYPKSQSIFITPQDITTIGDLDQTDVRIHQMAAPRSD